MERVYDRKLEHLLEGGLSMDEAASAIKSFPPEVRTSALGDLVDYLAHYDPKASLDALAEYFPSNPDMWSVMLRRRAEIMEQLGYDDFGEVSAFLQDQLKKGLDPKVYRVAVQQLTADVARQDIEEARATVEAIADPVVREGCTKVLLDYWKGGDPFGAASYVSTLPAGHGRDLAIETLLPSLVFASAKRDEVLALASSEDVRAALRAGKKLETEPGKP